MNLLEPLGRDFSAAADPDRLHAGRDRLAADVLRRHVAANRHLAPRADELEALAAAIDASPDAARNPELFPFLIAARFVNADLTPALVDKIRWHAGFSDSLGAGLTPGYHRSARGPGVHRLQDGALEPVEGCWTTVESLRVYLPRLGLFRDLLGADLYPDLPPARSDDELQADLARAFEIVRLYDDALHAEILRCFAVCVLTTDFGTVRSSFNLRLRYVGGLFLNPFHETPLGLAEGLVHEYYHQRIWHWWWNEPVEGMPGEDVQVTSPVTGRRRPVPVMTHALVIYTALAELHATLAGVLDGEEAAAAEARARRLDAGLDPLHEALRRSIAPKSRAEALLDVVGQLRRTAGPTVDAGGKLG